MQMEFGEGFIQDRQQTQDCSLNLLDIFEGYEQARGFSLGSTNNADEIEDTSDDLELVEGPNEPIQIIRREDGEGWERYFREAKEFEKEMERFKKIGAFLGQASPETLKSPAEIADMIARNGLSEQALTQIRNSISCAGRGTTNPITEINRALAASGVQLRISERFDPQGPPQLERVQGGTCLVYAQVVDNAGNPVKDANGKPSQKMPLYSEHWITVHRFEPPYNR